MQEVQGLCVCVGGESLTMIPASLFSYNPSKSTYQDPFLTSTGYTVQKKQWTTFWQQRSIFEIISSKKMQSLKHLAQVSSVSLMNQSFTFTLVINSSKMRLVCDIFTNTINTTMQTYQATVIMLDTMSLAFSSTTKTVRLCIFHSNVQTVQNEGKGQFFLPFFLCE